MSDDCLGCALLETQLEDLKRTVRNHLSTTTNCLERLKIMIESDETDEALKLLEEMNV